MGAKGWINSEKQRSNLAVGRALLSTLRRKCAYCERDFRIGGFSNHTRNCYLNPTNLRICPVCSHPIKNYKTGTTCSYSCANKYFRSKENHPNWDPDVYRSTCFVFHEKRCVVCGEENLVEVHHHDGKHENNDPKNLVPLCPTHHQYCHSRYLYAVELTFCPSWRIQARVS